MILKSQSRRDIIVMSSLREKIEESLYAAMARDDAAFFERTLPIYLAASHGDKTGLDYMLAHAVSRRGVPFIKLLMAHGADLRAFDNLTYLAETK